MSELLPALLRLNLAAGAAVLLALFLRRPARRLFGPRVAYGVWSVVPLAAAATLLPPRIITLVRPAAAMTWGVAATPVPVPAPIAAPSSAPGVLVVLLALWLVGVFLAAAGLAWRQVQFGRAVRAGRAGPAVVGVLKPRIVTPDDFARAYTPREQAAVLAHEATHIARQDSRINALVALARCLAWFNPLVHALAHYLRIDQELACDAQALARLPAGRRAYAEAMLKTQLAVRPLPLGCYWPAPSAHPLAERILLLSQPPKGPARRALGAGVAAAVALAAGLTAWAAKPAEVVVVTRGGPQAWPAPAAQGPAPPPAAKPSVAKAARPATAAAWTPGEAPQPEPLPISTEPSPIAASPPEGCGVEPVADRRELQPGDFGPARRIHSAAAWSSVEPGSAVRVYASMTDPDGVPLITDLTAFGSQSWYRVGCIRSHASRFKLFTSVEQRGERLRVTALLAGAPPRNAGTLDLASGETGTITLRDGQQVNVTAIKRPETPEETAQAQREGEGRRFVNVLRFAQDS